MNAEEFLQREIDKEVLRDILTEFAETILDLPLLPLTDPRLFVRPKDFDFENPGIDPVVFKDKLIERLVKSGGVGLSANQIGLNHRVFVYGTNGDYQACFNPKIHGASEERVLMREGCLSAPGLWLQIARPVTIVASWQNELGETKTGEITGLSSRIFQHEFDHMQGANFTIHASALKLQRALAQMKKKIRAHKKLVAADVR